jgi:hypothetical protein
VSSSPIAAEQHAALLTIDTACHGLRGVTSATDCFAGGALIRLFHINRLQFTASASYPRSTVFDYFHALRLLSCAADRPAILGKRLVRQTEVQPGVGRETHGD